MVALLLIGAATLHLVPGDASAVVAWASTNIDNLADHPLAAMVVSTFVVPGNLIPDLAIVAISFAILERAVGPWRTALIALTGQVVATLLTEYGIELGAHWHLLTESSPDRADVGVSYAMYAVLAAAALSLPRPARTVGLLTVAGSVLYPLIVSPGMTPTGHVLSVAVGATVMTSISRSAHRRAATSSTSRNRLRASVIAARYAGAATGIRRANHAIAATRIAATRIAADAELGGLIAEGQYR